MIFCDWFLLLSVFPRFIHVVECINTLLFLLLDSILLYGISSFIYPSSIDGNLGCFHFGAIMSDASLDSHVKVWGRHMISIIIAGSYEISVI